MSSLGLTAEELDALGRQGFVATERRGANRVYYKLRFRLRGRQHVKYLGGDPAAAERVRAALQQRQAPGHRRRELRQAARQARRAIRAAKQRLLPRVEDAGFTFHGLAVRRKRQGTAANHERQGE